MLHKKINPMTFAGLPSKQTLTVESIIEAVEKVRGVSFEMIKSKDRKHPACVARQFCWLIIHDNGLMSLEAIGKHFGYHHSTIVDGKTAIRRTMRIDDQASADFDKINKMLGLNF